MLSVFTLLLAAQSALLIDVPAGPKVPATVNTSNGEVWVAGRDQVLRLSPSGVTLLKVPVNGIGSITALAVDRSGGLALLAADSITSNFLLISPAGEILTRRQLDGSGQALVLDSLGFAFVAGRATDGFRATLGAYKTEFGPPACFGKFVPPYPCSDAFVTKLRLDGTILWSTLLGGSRDDAAQAIGIDAQGAIWVAGDTVSSNLPTTPSAFQRSYGGGEALGPFEYGDGFLARIDPSGTQLLYASYLGGSRFDQVSTLVITPQAIILGGSTDSPNFPVTPDALQRRLATDQIQLPRLQADAFLAAVSHTGALLYATYYGEPGQQFASSSTIGKDSEVGIAIEGLPRRCILKFELRNATPSLRPDCLASPVEAPFTALFNNGQWVLAGSTKSGLPRQTTDDWPRLVLFPFVFDNPLPAVTAVWADNDPAHRPLVSLDSWVTVFTDPAVNLNGVSVIIAGHPLTVSYAGNGQINAYVPAGIPLGIHPLVIALPFFNSIPVPVDVRADWPGLASAALNEDGSINSAANPAKRGSIVSLFATGLGSLPLPLFEAFIQISSPIAAQGMELRFVGRISDGLVQINARIPFNALPGTPQVRIVYKDRPQYLGSNLARIFVD